MLTYLYYWKNKSDLPYVTYTVLTNILTCVETDIPTWCYSNSYVQDTVASMIYYDKDR